MNRRRSIRLVVLLPSLAAAALVVGLTPTPAAAAGPPSHRPSKRVCPGPVIGTAACHARVITDRAGTPLASSGPSGYGPTDFHTAYRLPDEAPASQTIAIVDAYDDPTIESDLATYSSTYGLPPCNVEDGCFRKVNQSGQEGSYPKADGGWSLEIALDVETAHAICQNCRILLVEASSSTLADLGAAVDTAAELGATEISNSYGGSEFSGEAGETAYRHPGIAITASAGDSGYGAEYPAASPEVVAVGGTTLNLGPSHSYGSETAWSESGSGCSAYLPAQPWQTSDPNWAATGCGSRRGIADVAADADPNTGASVYDSTKYQGQSGWFTVGGTSLSAPLIASVYALAGGGVGDYPAAGLYAHQADSPASLHDVTSGSNGTCEAATICAAAAGYDGPTGVGTPDGIAAFGEPPPDKTPPETAIDSGPAAATNEAEATFAFSSNEPSSSFECSLDGGSFASCSSPYVTAALADGPHSFEVRAIDLAGNTDPTPAQLSFDVDTRAPQVSLTAPAAGTISADPAPILAGTAGTAPGDGQTVTLEIYAGTGTAGTPLQTPGAAVDPVSGAYSVAAATLPSGTYTARASQSDSAGNTGLSTAHTFVVDAVAPVSAAASPAATGEATIPVSYAASDAGGAGLAAVELWAEAPGEAQYRLVATDTSPGATGSFSYEAGAGYGTYSFYTRARDAAGNYEPAPGVPDARTVLETAGPPAVTPPDVTALPEGNSGSAGQTLGAEVTPPLTAPARVVLTGVTVRPAGRTGVETLIVGVPGPGSLVLFGRKVRTARRTAAGAGSVRLPLRPRAPQGRRGIGRTKVEVTFTPSGGSPVTDSFWVKLRGTAPH